MICVVFHCFNGWMVCADAVIPIINNGNSLLVIIVLFYVFVTCPLLRFIMSFFFAVLFNSLKNFLFCLQKRKTPMAVNQC